MFLEIHKCYQNLKMSVFPTLRAESVMEEDMVMPTGHMNDWQVGNTIFTEEISLPVS